MNGGVKSVVFNGQRGGAGAIKPWLQALANAALVREKGGFLFKAAFDNDTLHLAVAPSIIEGVRSRHYDMPFKGENGMTLVGDVNAEGEFTLLFKPDRIEDIESNAAAYIAICHRFAVCLVEMGYSGEGAVSDVSQGMFHSLGVAVPPKNLKDLGTLTV